MILEQLHIISSKGSKLPIAMWQEEYETLLSHLLPQLQGTLIKLKQESSTKVLLDRVIKELSASPVNELELSRALMDLGSELEDDTTFSNLITNYLYSSRRFFERSHLSQHAAMVRDNIKRKFDEQQMKEYDIKLFSNEGMLYCLEYYLAIYKTYHDMKDNPDEQSRLLKQADIDLGSGKVTNLITDFKNDEVLEKFILRVLTDNAREKLLAAHYECKVLVIEQDDDAHFVLKCLKEYLHVLIDTFIAFEIKKLKSTFFTPYGKQRPLHEIKELL